MNIVVKPFSALTTQELYALLQLRTQIFVVEQDCVYQDLDGKDQKALHVIGTKNNKVVAYTRCFKAGIYFDQASIGRVVVAQEFRKDKLGKRIMEASIQAIYKEYGVQPIKLSAQTYLLKFYNALGFKAIGDQYLEDGIPHIAMIKE